MKARVLYDGDCPLCRKSVRILRRLDWLGRLDYVNAREITADSDARLTDAPLLDEMHVLTPAGALHRGFDAFRWLAWRLPVCWSIAPLLYLPGVPWLGHRLYLWVARNRFHLVPCQGGVCEIKHRGPV
jgi:predicted DCC family thiol-disulfide oxidoreductase YuxK